MLPLLLLAALAQAALTPEEGAELKAARSVLDQTQAVMTDWAKRQTAYHNERKTPPGAALTPEQWTGLERALSSISRLGAKAGVVELRELADESLAALRSGKAGLLTAASELPALVKIGESLYAVQLGIHNMEEPFKENAQALAGPPPAPDKPAPPPAPARPPPPEPEPPAGVAKRFDGPAPKEALRLDSASAAARRIKGFEERRDDLPDAARPQAQQASMLPFFGPGRPPLPPGRAETRDVGADAAGWYWKRDCEALARERCNPLADGYKRGQRLTPQQQERLAAALESSPGHAEAVRRAGALGGARELTPEALRDALDAVEALERWARGAKRAAGATDVGGKAGEGRALLERASAPLSDADRGWLLGAYDAASEAWSQAFRSWAFSGGPERSVVRAEAELSELALAAAKALRLAPADAVAARLAQDPAAAKAALPTLALPDLERVRALLAKGRDEDAAAALSAMFDQAARSPQLRLDVEAAAALKVAREELRRAGAKAAVAKLFAAAPTESRLETAVAAAVASLPLPGGTPAWAEDVLRRSREAWYRRESKRRSDETFKRDALLMGAVPAGESLELEDVGLVTAAVEDGVRGYWVGGDFLDLAGNLRGRREADRVLIGTFDESGLLVRGRRREGDVVFEHSLAADGKTVEIAGPGSYERLVRGEDGWRSALKRTEAAVDFDPHLHEESLGDPRLDEWLRFHRAEVESGYLLRVTLEKASGEVQLLYRAADPRDGERRVLKLREGYVHEEAWLEKPGGAPRLQWAAIYGDARATGEPARRFRRLEVDAKGTVLFKERLEVRRAGGWSPAGEWSPGGEEFRRWDAFKAHVTASSVWRTVKRGGTIIYEAGDMIVSGVGGAGAVVVGGAYGAFDETAGNLTRINGAVEFYRATLAKEWGASALGTQAKGQPLSHGAALDAALDQSTRRADVDWFLDEQRRKYALAEARTRLLRANPASDTDFWNGRAGKAELARVQAKVLASLPKDRRSLVKSEDFARFVMTEGGGAAGGLEELRSRGGRWARGAGYMETSASLGKGMAGGAAVVGLVKGGGAVLSRMLGARRTAELGRKLEALDDVADASELAGDSLFSLGDGNFSGAAGDAAFRAAMLLYSKSRKDKAQVAPGDHLATARQLRRDLEEKLADPERLRSEHAEIRKNGGKQTFEEYLATQKTELWRLRGIEARLSYKAFGPIAAKAEDQRRLYRERLDRPASPEQIAAEVEAAGPANVRGAPDYGATRRQAANDCTIQSSCNSIKPYVEAAGMTYYDYLNLLRWKSGERGAGGALGMSVEGLSRFYDEVAGRGAMSRTRLVDPGQLARLGGEPTIGVIKVGSGYHMIAVDGAIKTPEGWVVYARDSNMPGGKIRYTFDDLKALELQLIRLEGAGPSLLAGLKKAWAEYKAADRTGFREVRSDADLRAELLRPAAGSSAPGAEAPPRLDPRGYGEVEHKGEGQNGLVYRARSKDGWVALKRPKTNIGGGLAREAMVAREVAKAYADPRLATTAPAPAKVRLLRVHGHGLVPLETFTGAKPARPADVEALEMEWLDGTDLSKTAITKDEAAALQGALRRLHELGYAFGDFRLDNVKVVDTPNGRELVLLDFGSVRSLKDGHDKWLEAVLKDVERLAGLDKFGTKFGAYKGPRPNKPKEFARKLSEGHGYKDHVVRDGHFRHLGVRTPAEYAQLVEHVMLNARPENIRVLARGRVAWWDPGTEVIVVYDPSHVDGGTAFPAKKGRRYFDHLDILSFSELK